MSGPLATTSRKERALAGMLLASSLSVLLLLLFFRFFWKRKRCLEKEEKPTKEKKVEEEDAQSQATTSTRDTMSTCDDDLNENEIRLTLGLEYTPKDNQLSFYVENTPIIVPSKRHRSLAKILVVSGLSKRTWIGRRRDSFTEAEVIAYLKSQHATLAVERCFTTIFNEFFTSTITPADFPKTMLRVQLCNVDKYERTVPIAELDYWADTHPIASFTEFQLPMTPSVFVQVEMFVRGKLYDYQRSEPKRTVAGLEVPMDDLIIFDVKAEKLRETLLLFSVYEKRPIVEETEVAALDPTVLKMEPSLDVEERFRKLKIGEFGISHSSPHTDHVHWSKMLRQLREPVTEVHKLNPG